MCKRQHVRRKPDPAAAAFDFELTQHVVAQLGEREEIARGVAHRYEGQRVEAGAGCCPNNPVSLPVRYDSSLVGQFPGKSGIVAAAYADGIHQNDFGNYIVGCTYYATMFKTSPSGFSGSRYGVSDQDASIIKQTVWDVVTTKSFTGVTGSTRTSAPLLPVQPQTTAGSTALFDIGGRTFSQPHSLRRHAASACITRTAAGTGASALFPVR